MTQPPDIFQRIYARHGHRCPMSTLGGRMGLAAMTTLGPQPVESLEARYAHDTCAVDGIDVITSYSIHYTKLYELQPVAWRIPSTAQVAAW